MKRKIVAIIGTVALAIGLMAIPAFAAQGQAYRWGQMQSYMQQVFNNQSSVPNESSTYGYGMTNGYKGVNSNGAYGMTSGYGGVKSYNSYGMTGSHSRNSGYGMMSGYSGSNSYGGYGMMGGM